MKKFKEGDRVITNRFDNQRWFMNKQQEESIGMEGIVMLDSNSDYIYVKHPGYNEFWAWHIDSVELVDPTIKDELIAFLVKRIDNQIERQNTATELSRKISAGSRKSAYCEVLEFIKTRKWD